VLAGGVCIMIARTSWSKFLGLFEGGLVRSLQISSGCWVALMLGVACGGSKTSPPADAAWPPQGGAGGEGTGGTAITATGGSAAAGGATGTGGAGLPDASAGNGGATGTGGAAGTGGIGPNDARVASDGTSSPEDALDAPSRALSTIPPRHGGSKQRCWRTAKPTP
jgi:hypothetical protein